ncbi:MAG: SMI1/KNR4 family protein [Povalibacter sp.]
MTFNWEALLARSARVAAQVMGKVETFAPATESDIVAAEQRLGVTFPSSVRSFYEATNGWGFVGFIWGVHPVQSIGWMRDVEPQLYEILSEHPYEADVAKCLVVSSSGDVAYWILDPFHCDARGEWRAGRWASWHPGMHWSHADFYSLFESEVQFREALKDR